MKRFLSFLMLATMAFAFVSCGDDDDKTTKTWDDPITDSKAYTLSILSSAGADFNIPVTIKLEDFSKLLGLTDKVKTAEATADSFIQISGVEAGTYSFETLTLMVEGTDIKRTYVNVNTDGIHNGVGTDLTFLNKLAKRLADKKEVKVRLIGKSDKEVNKNVNVKINLNILFDME